MWIIIESGPNGAKMRSGMGKEIDVEWNDLIKYFECAMCGGNISYGAHTSAGEQARYFALCFVCGAEAFIGKRTGDKLAEEAQEVFDGLPEEFRRVVENGHGRPRPNVRQNEEGSDATE